MSPFRRKALLTAAEIALLLTVHVVLLHVMAERNVVSTILASGSHIPRGVAWTAGAFLIVRLFAVLLLPGIILARLIELAWSLKASAHQEAPPT